MSVFSKYVDEILNEVKDLPEEQISNLLKIIHLFKESIIKQREHDFAIKVELEEWDRLSDEAFMNFERSL